MSKLARLTKHDLEHLATTLESALSVSSRPQFYLWAQGALQGFIPHETLFCAFGDMDKMQFKFEVFSSVARKPDSTGVDPATELLPRIVDDWLRHGSQPRLYCASSTEQVGRRQLIADLKKLNLGSASAHGPGEIQGRFGSFFLFAGLQRPPTQRDAHLLQLFMPYLHMALYRVLGRQTDSGDAAGSEVLPSAMFSKREIQVLHWVKNGKTNLEISQILEISQPTVKSHVQNIMRKLNVTNRAQAVGKSATLRLLAPTDKH
ncbi:helix-turn-helix transcriptional regulator [Rhodoferax lacus]|uniref:Helix-turn-helix transcriptional regulator n=1 Tax=Rhodoferax lacus TaxID=2184758 RepID=A0A3E1RAU6_9BURK|nr:XrtB/PEP-CTERM-associated transcriptional regulator EpsA [Rhodoferax lacus]RFO95780.1 helix-turn-helix transcriptional regulator [Rhodoferax lacus]